jgi:lipopolysaccharide export system protein LptC
MTTLDDDTTARDDRRPGEATRIRYNPTRVRDAGSFERAERHSRRVRRLRYILPGLAILGVVIFWGTARFIPGDMESLVESSGIDVKTNSVVMQAPHIAGFEGTRRSYEVKAASAVQGLADPKVVTFNTIEGRFGLDDDGEAQVAAPSGIYDGNTNTLKLTEGIQLTTTDGYAARLTDAAIDLEAGSLISDRPLELKSAEGSLKAGAIEVQDRGKRVVFKDGVSVTYLPPGELAAAPAAPATGTP